MSWAANNSYEDGVGPNPPFTNGGQGLSPSSGSDVQQEERQASVSSGSSSQDYGNKERITVPSACTQCRSKHLKCDGANPCSRCSTNGFDCEYVKSRRGFKGPRKNTQNKGISTTGTVISAPRACPLVRPGAARVDISSGLVTPPHSRQPVAREFVDRLPVNQDLISLEANEIPAGLDMRERCIEAFFYHFYPAHPFLLPRLYFMKLRKEKSLKHLEAAMRYVGSFYVPQAPSTTLGAEAELLLHETESSADGFTVQAMLVLAIGLDGYFFQEKALQFLIRAQDLALSLGMNLRGWDSAHGNGSKVLEESWRRTWWELYIIDGMIAGVHQKSSFRLNEVQADVLLPCEEQDYAAGIIPTPHSMLDFTDESFNDHGLVFSSFTYRIAAMRNVGRILAVLPQLAVDRNALWRVDAHLVNWKLHLPDSKRAVITNNGQVDEMLFQAHMMSEASMILLHREFSELDSSIAKDVSSCAPHKAVAPGDNYNTHAAKIISSAQEISKLISLPVPLIQHTHFFTCVVTLASIVHLSCWSIMHPLIHDEDLKQQLRLNTGALKTLRQVWPSAGQAFGQVKVVASEIFSAKKLAVESGIWSNLSNDQVMQSMIEDRNIMEELDLIEMVPNTYSISA